MLCTSACRGAVFLAGVQVEGGRGSRGSRGLLCAGLLQAVAGYFPRLLRAGPLAGTVCGLGPESTLSQQCRLEGSKMVPWKKQDFENWV